MNTGYGFLKRNSEGAPKCGLNVFIILCLFNAAIYHQRSKDLFIIIEADERCTVSLWKSFSVHAR